MNWITSGVLAGIVAIPAWFIVNLLADLLFLPVIRKHLVNMNPVLVTHPAMNLLVLAVDLIFWGAVFCGAYGLLYPGLERFGPAGGIIWGIVMFVSFSRSMVESSIWTKFPRDLNLFWFVEGLAGLVAWGAAFGVAFYRFI